MSIIKASATLVALVVLTAVSKWFSPRRTGGECRSRIGAALRQEASLAGVRVRLDDGVWEADEAYSSDGREYDPKLQHETFAITKREAHG
jgi:hypothetical protein